MLSACFGMFNRKKSKDYYELGGPRSFHKFIYKKIQVILIGEVHQDMPTILAKKYIDIFNQFVEKNDHVKLFLEKTNNEEKQSDHSSFIDSMQGLVRSPRLEVINGDDRQFDDGFNSLFFFLKNLEKIEDPIRNTINAAYKKKKLTPPLVMPFFSEDADFIKGIEKISDSYDKKYTFGNLLEMLTSQIKILDKLCDKYSKIDINLRNYIADCILNINDALDLTLKLLNKFLSIKNNKEKEDEIVETMPLIRVCIELMIHEKTFYPAKEFFDIYNLYLHSFLNATLICKLWDEINNEGDENEKTLIAVTGDAHTESLAPVFKVLCTQVASISADPHGSVISPEMMTEFLANDFAHAPNIKSMCTIL